jgi:hypothetical protein
VVVARSYVRIFDFVVGFFGGDDLGCGLSTLETV